MGNRWPKPKRMLAWTENCMNGRISTPLSVRQSTRKSKTIASTATTIKTNSNKEHVPVLKSGRRPKLSSLLVNKARFGCYAATGVPHEILLNADGNRSHIARQGGKGLDVPNLQAPSLQYTCLKLLPSFEITCIVPDVCADVFGIFCGMCFSQTHPHPNCLRGPIKRVS